MFIVLFLMSLFLAVGSLNAQRMQESFSHNTPLIETTLEEDFVLSAFPLPQEEPDSVEVAEVYLPQKKGMIYLLNGLFYRVYVDSVTAKTVVFESLAEEASGFRAMEVDSVLMIAFDDGEVLPIAIETYEIPNHIELSLVEDLNIFRLGFIHADVYYREKNNVGEASIWINALATPIVGMFYNIVESAFPFKDKNLHYPSPLLAEDADYSLGYKAKAAMIKSEVKWSTTGNLFIVYGLAGVLFWAGH